MIEVIRRLLLAAGLASAIVLAMYTPPALLRAYFVDFARDYDNYGKSAWPQNVVESLVEKPATLELFIEEKVGSRRVDVSGDSFVSFLARLKAAAASKVEAPSTTTQGGVGPDIFLRPGDPPLDTLAASFQASRDSGWLNTYVAVATPAGREFFEVLVVTEPRDSAAPPSLVHPLRPYAWWALLAGLGAYLLLPRSARRRGNTVTYDPFGSVLPLDGLGALWLSVCVFVPLWATDTTAEALGEEFGLTVFFGLLALLAMPAFFNAARKAEFSVVAEPDRLVFTSVGGQRTVKLSDIVSVEDLIAGKLKSGVLLRLVSNDAIKLDWTDLERFEIVLRALAPFAPADFGQKTEYRRQKTE